jgi:hypothetical protein
VCRTCEKIEQVTGSQDDGFVGSDGFVGVKNIRLSVRGTRKDRKIERSKKPQALPRQAPRQAGTGGAGRMTVLFGGENIRLAIAENTKRSKKSQPPSAAKSLPCPPGSPWERSRETCCSTFGHKQMYLGKTASGFRFPSTQTAALEILLHPAPLSSKSRKITTAT